MAKKTAQVDIKITGTESIASLENELAQINKDIKNIDVNSKAFKSLSDRASEVQGKLRNAKVQLEGVTGKKQAEAAFKLGETFSKAFATMQASSLLFGKKSQEDFQKVAAKVATLMLALDTVRVASELFSAETLKGLGKIGSGFGTLVTKVKGASTSMKIALASTGIGLLIVALGVVAANWDKITAAIKRNRKEKELEKSLEAQKKEIEYQEKLLTEQDKQREAQKKLNDLNKDAQANKELEKQRLQDLIALEQKRKKEAEDAAKLAKLRAEEAQKKADDAQAASERALESIKYGNNAAGTSLLLAEKKLKKQTEIVAEQEKELALQTEIGETADANLKLYEAQVAELSKFNLVAATMKDMLEDQKDYSNLLEGSLTIYGKMNNMREAMAEQDEKLLQSKKDELYFEQEILRANGELTDEREREFKRQQKSLSDQITALRVSEDIRKAELALETEKTKRLIDQVKYYEGVSDELANQRVYARALNNLEEDRVKAGERNRKLIELTNIGIQDAITLREQVVNFDKIGNKLYQDKVTNLVPSEIKLTKELYNQVNRMISRYETGFKTVDEFGKRVEELTFEYEKNLQFQSQIQKLDKEKLRDAASQLATQKALSEIVINDLDAQIKIAAQQKENNEETFMTLEGQKNILKQQRETLDEIVATKEKILTDGYVELANGKKKYLNDEEILSINKDLLDAVDERRSINDEINGITQDTMDILNEQSKIDEQIVELENQKVDATAQVEQNQQAVTDQLEEQSRISTQLNDFVNQYAAEIDVVRQTIGAMFELWATQQDNIAKKNRRLWQDYQNNINKSQKKIDDLNKSQLDYEEELKDANGERYDELMALMGMTEEQREAAVAAEQADIDANLQKQKEAEYAIAQAEYKAEKRRKAAAIVDAAIAAALAVIKALPNVFLAVATGVLSAVQIAIVASQKVIEPKKEDFGLARGGLLVGASHKEGGIPITSKHGTVEAEGGEFVVNRKATEQYLPLIAAINEQGRKRMAEGGQLTPVAQAVNDSSFIDYNQIRLAMKEAVQGLTVVTELVPLQRGLDNVAKVKTTAGI